MAAQRTREGAAVQQPETEATQRVPKALAHHHRVTGLDVRVDRVGEGQPLVFLNGLLGLNEHWFGCLRYLVGPEVRCGNECLFFEAPLLQMRGPGCSVEGVTNLTTSLLETLVDGPAVLIGNSLGGHVALKIAIERPELVRGLVLMGSSGLYERTFDKDVERNPSREWMERKIEGLFHNPERMFPGMVDMAHEALSRRTAVRSLVRLGKSAKRDHLGEQLHKVNAPVLLAWGKEDAVTPPDVAEQFAAQLPNAQLRWIDQCGHAPQIECPEILCRYVREFCFELSHIASGADGQAGVA